jgi:16S rRNA G966 N2-methylase RsmD
MDTDVLYYGDNLGILRRYLPDAVVDLVYIDPPFNSNRDDNVIFRDESHLTVAASQPAPP